MTTSSQDLFQRHMATLTRPNVSPAPTANDLWSELRRLLPQPAELDVTDDPDAPELWSVWSGIDLLGAGATRSEALADAIETVRGWEN